MKIKIFKIRILIIGMLINSIVLSQSQTFISELWSGQGGEMAVFYKNKTVTDNIRNVYVTGSTLNLDGNIDIIVQKFSRGGNLLWQQTFNGNANMDDMASDIFVDNDYNVYVTGASIDNVNDNFDLVVLKFNSIGVLQWSYYYDNGATPLPKDVGTAIIGDNNGGIYVTGSSFGKYTMLDYVTLKLNSTSGNQIWEKRYDYDDFNDISSTINYDGTNIYVSGGSQISTSQNRWQLATIAYEASTGLELFVRRSQGNATSGIDEVFDIAIDNTNNIYVTGAVVNESSGYDISLYKLDNQLNIIWEEHFDGFGLDDKGFGVKIDSEYNVYVAGYLTHPNEGRNFGLVKYNSIGELQWFRQFNGLANLDDEAVQLVIDLNDNIFVTGATTNSNNFDFVTLGYTSHGELFCQVGFNGESELHDKPSDIAIDLDGNIIVVGQTEVQGGIFENQTVKYIRYEKSFEPVTVNGIVSHNKGEVIIRFNRDAVVHDAIDKKEFEAGMLKDFVTQSTITEMSNKLQMDVSRLETYKIFRRMTTADTISVTRLGDTIRIDDFWATLSVYFPENYDEQTVADSLSTISDSIIHYAHLNGIIERHNIPNDPLVTIEQAGLIPTISFPNAHISVDYAWDIEVGQSHTKVGVFDDPIYWAHEDFGDGTYNGSKIEGGLDYYNNVHISGVLSPGSSHGTSVAGVIGALRNNNTGIAGIAGGDVDGANNKGVLLYSMGIFSSGDFSSISIAASAIVEGAANTGTYGYGLNIQNHSWGGPQSVQVLEDAVTTAWRHHCVLVASRGNRGHLDNAINYPACYSDIMILNTGASGVNGEYKNTTNGDNWWASSFGNNVDFIAPGTTEIVASPINPISPYDYPNNCTSSLYPEYQCFNGTSAAAPHVAGVAALMYSKHHVNNSAPNNLATEDIEYILEKNATDKGAAGYDQFNGWGLINAHASLEKVNYPSYYVKHAPTATPTQTTAANQNVIIANNTDGIAAGQYIADRIQLNWTYVDVLPTQHEIIDWWTLEAKTYRGVGANVPITGVRHMSVTPNVTIGGNAAVFSVQTFAWWVKTAVGSGQTINKWIPAGGPSQLRYSYSLHVKDNSITSIDENTLEKDINLFPNPVSDIINLTMNFENASDAQLEIFDAQGKIIANPSLGHKAQGEHTFSINVSNLSNGLYLLKVTSGQSTITKRFIKQ
jgi:hypothetical protein